MKGTFAIAVEDTPPLTGGCERGCPACADLRRAAVALAGSMGLDAVTPERLAQVAGVPASALAEHGCGDVGACVAAAYEETVTALQARYAARLRAASTREQALRDATSDLLSQLARRPDVAAFVSVEVLAGGRDLLVLRERLRRRSIANVRRELARFDGAGLAPELQVELLVAAIAHTIARHVGAGRTARLPEALDRALALADACEPLSAD